MKNPCENCKGQALTHGKCHIHCHRYEYYKHEVEEARKNMKNTQDYLYYIKKFNS